MVLVVVIVVVNSAGVQREGVGAVDHRSVEDDVDVAVAGNDGRKVLPARRKKNTIR